MDYFELFPSTFSYHGTLHNQVEMQLKDIMVISIADLKTTFCYDCAQLTVSMMSDWVLNVFFMIYHRMGLRIASMAISSSQLLKSIFLKVFVRPFHVIGPTFSNNLAIKYAITN